MELLTDTMMYEALVNKDTTCEGSFIAAVKTTGIFCRTTCTAKKPKRENVEFFKTTKEAMLKGYRPCKVCRPMERVGETPEHVATLLQELHSDPSLRFRDSTLRERGIEPVTLRRWFLKNHGITFQAYQRITRINTAFKKLQKGGSATAAAYDAGYESLSGFGDSFKSVLGIAPSKASDQGIMDLTRLQTPLGTMIACAVEDGICLLEFTDRRMLETQFKLLSRHFGTPVAQGYNKHFELLQQELTEYFDGVRSRFTVPLVTPGSHFQQSVWKELQNIPYGATRSYKQQATALGAPAAVRAVAGANGMNRISIIIPCHRVIGGDGHLTGYGGGVWRKKWLLELEAAHAKALSQSGL
jgi:AraC family transcriptional regulator of adaptative response/methylated-DNA-[protein]-cysteine methyltransferase